VINRLRRCSNLDAIVIATTASRIDDEIVSFCEENSVECFRGSEVDVLRRFFEAATLFQADWVLRITADCPAIDSEIVDEVIRLATGEKWDCFGLGGSFPNGLDCTVYSYAALSSAHEKATLQSDREHVGTFIIRSQEFRTGSYDPFADAEDFRWTLDEPEDYLVLTHIFDELGAGGRYFSGHETLNYLSENSEVKAINSHIVRNEGYLRSLAKDELVENQNWGRND
jgi:spore coat polysaccharide biosynthesis protein SpsF (cytidylyltransferase family)